MIKKDTEGPLIMKKEMGGAIKKMKHGKTALPDIIPVEVIVALEELGIEVLTELLNSRDKIPDDLMKSDFIALSKTSGATKCE